MMIPWWFLDTNKHEWITDASYRTLIIILQFEDRPSLYMCCLKELLLKYDGRIDRHDRLIDSYDRDTW